MATVLVVEDEVQIRDLVAEDLQEAGFAVIVAKNADLGPLNWSSLFF
jgi:DNA-binding response OmpR family regulator